MTRLTGDMSQAAIDFDTATLSRFLGIITALMAVQAVSAAISALVLGRFAAKAGYRFRDNFARYFLRIPFAQLEKDSTGESLSIYTNDLPRAITFVSQGGMQMVADFLALIVTFVYMLILAPVHTLIFFGMFPVLIVMQVLISAPIQKKNIIMSEEQARFNEIVNDSLQNVSTIAAYSLEDVMSKRYLAAYDKYFDMIKSFVRSFSVTVLAGIGATLAPFLVISGLTAVRTINGDMSVAEFVAFFVLALNAGSWLMMLSQRLTDVQVAAAGAKRFLGHMPEDICEGMDIYDKGDRIAGQTRNDGQAVCNTAVQFSDVHFSYTEDTETLTAINLSISKGQKVAFVGGSGSGKSTLLKLILGLYTPSSGTVKIFGQENAPISSFAYVPQDSFLFPESIGDNITGGTAPDKAKLELACRDAGIWDFINSLPDKFDGMLSESAENVSGGQKQRIALARAFYQDAPIILFDEATSALDPTTEAEVLTSFDSMISHHPDTTVIMVAHRAKAIAFCDTIVVMDGGKVVGVGSHEDLLKSCPEYAKE